MIQDNDSQQEPGSKMKRGRWCTKLRIPMWQPSDNIIMLDVWFMVQASWLKAHDQGGLGLLLVFMAYVAMWPHGCMADTATWL